MQPVGENNDLVRALNRINSSSLSSAVESASACGGIQASDASPPPHEPQGNHHHHNNFGEVPTMMLIEEEEEPAGSHNVSQQLVATTTTTTTTNISTTPRNNNNNIATTTAPSASTTTSTTSTFTIRSHAISTKKQLHGSTLRRAQTDRISDSLHKTKSSGLSKFYHKKARSFSCLSHLSKEKDARLLAKQPRADDSEGDNDNVVPSSRSPSVEASSFETAVTPATVIPPPSSTTILLNKQRESSPDFVAASSPAEPPPRRSFSCRTFGTNAMFPSSPPLASSPEDAEMPPSAFFLKPTTPVQILERRLQQWMQ
ncbi:hypothetical protein PPROV_001018900 [Pycnococcus provasolii]|uniref:Uncharacterized protein n=1 Tax=Pycnococcus provasolii TaxID=41880 RepID=A0A830I164_9CHLO|nr:hypothetical protein PPROV_001018900 [Pycnococcus provasolii]